MPLFGKRKTPGEKAFPLPPGFEKGYNKWITTGQPYGRSLRFGPNGGTDYDESHALKLLVCSGMPATGNEVPNQGIPGCTPRDIQMNGLRGMRSQTGHDLFEDCGRLVGSPNLWVSSWPRGTCTHYQLEPYDFTGPLDRQRRNPMHPGGFPSGRGIHHLGTRYGNTNDVPPWTYDSFRDIAYEADNAALNWDVGRRQSRGSLYNSRGTRQYQDPYDSPSGLDRMQSPHARLFCGRDGPLPYVYHGERRQWTGSPRKSFERLRPEG